MKRTHRRLRHVLVAAAMGTLVLTGCSGGEEAAAGKGTASQAADKPGPQNEGAKTKRPAAALDVRIVTAGVEDHKTWGPRAFVVHYKATNSGSQPASYYAEIEFLDQDGDHLGQTGITVDKLGPGKTSTGDTAPLESEIRNGQLTDIRSARVTKVDRTDAP
ncbi:hypothetical protein ACIQGT_14150 [Streptomyces sp. NPDC093108]|uniref:hypothetical protein n=1 Tax=unclassified Streptomyces TaxID=2593676 RepID=UPI0037F354E0